MRCKWYLVIVIIFVMLFNSNVYAESCDSTDIQRLKVVADDVDISYDYNDELYDTDGFLIYDTYKVIISNLSDELYVIESKTNLDLRNYQVNDGSITIDRLYSGKKNFKIYSKNCDNRVLKTYSVDLPKFNSYSTDPNCEGHEDLDICQKFYDTSNIDYNEFIKIIESDDDKINDSNDIKSNDENKYIKLIKDNYIYISVGGGILLMIIITLIVLKHKKRGALE